MDVQNERGRIMRSVNVRAIAQVLAALLLLLLIVV